MDKEEKHMINKLIAKIRQTGAPIVASTIPLLYCQMASAAPSRVSPH